MLSCALSWSHLAAGRISDFSQVSLLDQMCHQEEQDHKHACLQLHLQDNILGTCLVFVKELLFDLIKKFNLANCLLSFINNEAKKQAEIEPDFSSDINLPLKDTFRCMRPFNNPGIQQSILPWDSGRSGEDIFAPEKHSFFLLQHLI